MDIHTNFEEVLTFYNGEVTLVYDAALHAYYELVDGVKYIVPGSSTVTGMIDKSGPLTQWAANMTVQYLREKIPSITSFSKDVNVDLLDQLFNEARFNFKNISKDAKDIGTVAHDWLECYVKDVIEGNPLAGALIPAMPEDPKACNCIDAALKWMKIHKFRPLKSEMKVFSREYGYAGTFDWTGYVTSCGDRQCCPFDGTLFCLGDYKSSKTLYDEYRAQTASYQQAYNEEAEQWNKYCRADVERRLVEARVILRLGKEDGEFEPKVLLADQFERDLDGFLGALGVYTWLQQFKMDKKADKIQAKAEKEAAKIAARAAKPPRKKAVKRIVAPAEELLPIGA